MVFVPTDRLLNRTLPQPTETWMLRWWWAKGKIEIKKIQLNLSSSSWLIVWVRLDTCIGPKPSLLSLGVGVYNRADGYRVSRKASHWGLVQGPPPQLLTNSMYVRPSYLRGNGIFGRPYNDTRIIYNNPPRTPECHYQYQSGEIDLDKGFIRCPRSVKEQAKIISIMT